MSDYIAEIQSMFLKLHGCDASYVETVPVQEVFQGETVWQGDVEVFDLKGHPKATRGYGWGYVTSDSGGRRYFTVLELPPVDFATISSQGSDNSGRSGMRDKKAKVGRPKMPKGEAKAIVLQSRIQPAEREKYQKAAKAAGLDLSTWVRETLNRAVQ